MQAGGGRNPIRVGTAGTCDQQEWFEQHTRNYAMNKDLEVFKHGAGDVERCGICANIWPTVQAARVPPQPMERGQRGYYRHGRGLCCHLSLPRILLITPVFLNDPQRPSASQPDGQQPLWATPAWVPISYNPTALSSHIPEIWRPRRGSGRRWIRGFPPYCIGATANKVFVTNLGQSWVYRRGSEVGDEKITCIPPCHHLHARGCRRRK